MAMAATDRHLLAPFQTAGAATRGCSCRTGGVACGSGLGVLLDEGQGGVGDVPPAVVDGQRMPAAGDLDDLGHVGVALLPLVGGVGDGPRRAVVPPAVDDDQRPAAVRVVAGIC